MRKSPILLCLLALVFVSATTTWAAKLIMKDGSTLEGTVLPQGDGYWIHLPDGTSKIVPSSSVSKYVPDATGVLPSSNAESNAMGAFHTAQNQAAGVKSAVAAVAIWQEFVDKYPKSPDIDKAKAELDKWNKMATDGAEKIGDKWVTGDDLKQLHAQARALLIDAFNALKDHQTLTAVDKLKQCVKIYPNSFEAQFLLGDAAETVDNYKDAQKYFQQAVLLNAKSAEALNNLGVSCFFQHNLDSAVLNIYKACKLADEKVIVQNLATVLAHNETLRINPHNKQMVEDLKLLEAQAGVTGPLDTLYYMPYINSHTQIADTGQQADEAYSGSGCFINRDGLILTNRHVALGLERMTDKADPNIKVRLVVNTISANGRKKEQKTATLVGADDIYDLALIQVDLGHAVPFVSFSSAPRPQQGAECTVLGFPLASGFKVTRGIVSAVYEGGGDGSGADVITDAKVNPGNSGGPIVDKYGNLIAITRMKTAAFEEAGIESYGGGISVAHIREFLKKQKVDVTTGSDLKEMSTEDVAAQMKPVTVFIVGTMSKVTQ